MIPAKILGAAALLVVTSAWAYPAPGRPDPRSPELRRALALHPHTRRAVWIDLDPAAAATTLPPALSRDALERRTRWGVGVLAGDRPLPPALVRRLARAGARIRVQDRWSRSVSADVDSAAAERIARLSFVRALSPVLRLSTYALDPGTGSGTARAASTFAQDTFYGLLFPALRQLDIPAAHGMGRTGVGVRIGMLDSGFDRNHEALRPMKVLAQYDFIWNDTIVGNQPRDTFNQAAHGTGTASILGGYKPGSLVGAAYGASFLLAKTEVDHTGVDSHQDEDRWVQGALWLDSVGVDIISSSLGYRYDFRDSASAPMYAQPNGLWAYTCATMNGRTTRTSIAAAALARRHILLVTAVGNDADKHVDPTTHTNACTLSAPADADSVIAVGSVDSAGRPSVFSSRGPNGAGRIKPDLAAPGDDVYEAVSGTFNQYETASGTSMATPLIAGAAALVLQAWRNLDPLGVRLALEMATPRYPNQDNDVGFGVPDVASAIMFPQGLSVDQVIPADQLGVIGSIAPRFTWSAPLLYSGNRPLVFRIDVAADSAFRTILYSDTVSNIMEFRPRRALRPTRSLWWRVTASFNVPGGYTIQRQSNTSPAFTLPHWVRPVGINGPGTTFVHSLRPTFRWTQLDAPAPLGPMLFRVQVFNDSGRIVVNDTTRADSLTVRQPLEPNLPFTWRIIAQAHDADQTLVADTLRAEGNFVVASPDNPPSTALYQNFPNPFPLTDPEIVTTTRIWFDLATQGPVELAVYDLHGRLVRRLIPAPGCPAQVLGPGAFGRNPNALEPCGHTTWDGTDDNGRFMPRGVYLLRLRAGGTTQTRHIVYVPKG